MSLNSDKDIFKNDDSDWTVSNSVYFELDFYLFILLTHTFISSNLSSIEYLITPSIPSTY